MNYIVLLCSFNNGEFLVLDYLLLLYNQIQVTVRGTIASFGKSSEFYHPAKQPGRAIESISKIVASLWRDQPLSNFFTKNAGPSEMILVPPTVQNLVAVKLRLYRRLRTSRKFMQIQASCYVKVKNCIVVVPGKTLQFAIGLRRQREKGAKEISEILL